MVKKMCREDLDKRVCDLYDVKLTQTCRELIHIVDKQVYGQDCISDACLDAMDDEELTLFFGSLMELGYVNLRMGEKNEC